MKAATPRNALFFLLVVVSVIAFRTPLSTLVHYSLRSDKPYDQYTFTMAIPFISVVLAYADRQRIFAVVQYWYPGAALLLAGVALSWFAGRSLPSTAADNALSLSLLGLVIFWLAGFILCYGLRAFRVATFPLLFLLLTVPLPDSVLNMPVTAVQHGSAEVASLIFTLVGVPFVREGLIFILPNNAIEVAKECSGIHSTFAILIISLVAGHLFLATITRKVVLVLCALPTVFISNGVRIAGLTLLAEYVDPSFLHGDLHHKGGVIFFLLALVLLSFVLGALRRGHASSASMAVPLQTG